LRKIKRKEGSLMPNVFEIYITKDGNIFELEIFRKSKLIDFPLVNNEYSSVKEINNRISSYFKGASYGEFNYNLHIENEGNTFYSTEKLVTKVINIFTEVIT
jgi:hypothetical protein